MATKRARSGGRAVRRGRSGQGAAPGADPSAGYPHGSAGYARVLAGLLCAGIATFAQLYSLQGVLPGVAAGFGVDAAAAALSVSAATLGLALAVLPWSAAADRFGRKRTMGWALSTAVVLGLLVPLAPAFPALLALRFAEGAALGGIPAIALVYLNEELHRLHAAVGAGTYVAGTTIGGLTGRVVAGITADLLDWRAGVLAVGVLSALAAVVFLRLAPAPRNFRPAPSGGPGLWQRTVRNLRQVPLAALYAQGFLLMGGFVAVYNYLGFRLEAPPFGLPLSLISLLFLAYLSGTATSRLAAGLTVRFGRLPVLLTAIAVLLGGLALTLADTLALVLTGLVVFTGGFFAAHAVASGWTPRLAEAGAAQAASLYNFFYYAGSSLFGWLGGHFFSAFGWSGLAAFVALLAVLSGAAAAAALRGTVTP